MARAIKSDLVTPADTVRTRLTLCEKRVVDPGAGGGVPELFAWLDEIMAMWPELEAWGGDLRAERARWETLQAQVQRRGRQLLRAWPQTPALAELRQIVSPSTDRWWWWLDERLAQLRRQRVRRAATLAAVVLLAGSVLTFVLSRAFPVDPVVRTVYRLQGEIEQALRTGEQGYAAARDLAEQAVAVAPDDPDLRVLLGVAYQVLNEPERAAEQWAVARSLLSEDADFLLRRGSTYLMFGRPQEALQDEQAAIDLQPDNAPAHYFLGLALEGTGQYRAAIEAYTRAAELAEQSNPQLVVLARTRLAALLQQPAAPPASATAIP